LRTLLTLTLSTLLEELVTYVLFRCIYNTISGSFNLAFALVHRIYIEHPAVVNRTKSIITYMWFGWWFLRLKV